MRAVRFGILGPLEIRDIHGRPLEAPTGRSEHLLVGLLLRANCQVPLDWLTEMLWNGRSPRSYMANLQTYISRLRRTLPDVPIEWLQGGYRLSIDPDQVDAHRFVHHGEVGRAAAANGAAGQAADHFRRALALYRGAPLISMTAGPFEPDLARLAELRLTMLEGLTDAELASGQVTDAILRLGSLVRQHPLRESLWAQLMVALAKAGRVAEALESFHEVRTVLRDELGADPGERLRNLHQSILRGEIATDASPPRSACQLPPDIADLTGRSEVVSKVIEAVGRATSVPPVVAISGMPGIGKTALAVHVAHALRHVFPDGQLFARLSAPLELPGLDPIAWRSNLADKRVLLVLDDAPSARQVLPLLPGTAGCATIVTSRRRLTDLPGAQLILLNTLTDDEALVMLGRIVGTARVIDELAAAQEIGTYCAGLPLALRIAGVRLTARPDWRLATFATRLADESRRLDELAVDGVAVRTSLGNSYFALDLLARRTLRLLAKEIPVSALASALGVDQAIADAAVDRLIHMNLLECAKRPDEQPCYRIHELLGIFASERVQAREYPDLHHHVVRGQSSTSGKYC